MNLNVCKWCLVPQCRSSSIKNPEKLFFHVPTKKNVRKKWFQMARRDPTSLSANTVVYFCEDHFDLPNDMANYMEYHIMGKVSKVLKKPDCIPRKFLCQPDRRKRTLQTTERSYIRKKRKMRMVEELEQILSNRNEDSASLGRTKTEIDHAESSIVSTSPFKTEYDTKAKLFGSSIRTCSNYSQQNLIKKENSTYLYWCSQDLQLHNRYNK